MESGGGGLEHGGSASGNPTLQFHLVDLVRGLGLPELRRVWRWGAIIVAAFITLRRLIVRRTTLRLLRFYTLKTGGAQTHQPSDCTLNDDKEWDSTSSDGGDSDGDISRRPIGKRIIRFLGSPAQFNDAFLDISDTAAGGGCNFRQRLRRRSEVVCAGNQFSRQTVKLWRSGSSGNESSAGLHPNSKLNTPSLLTAGGRPPAYCAPSPGVVIAAEVKEKARVAMSVWDVRLGDQTPAVVAEWERLSPDVAAVTSGGVNKVYVKDADGSVAVGDLRNVGKLLFTHSGDVTWRDAVEPSF